jgi:hypothetical protein
MSRTLRASWTRLALLALVAMGTPHRSALA